MKILVTLAVIATVAVHGRVFRIRRSSHHEYKMCVPEELLGACNEMAGQETKTSARIVCIPARDRVECIDKIKERQADFGVMDPEDMYIAGNVPEEDFTVFEEIRTREEPDAEFRYEGVAVIHKDLDIKKISDIKGLRSCHTGVGRNVGYKIPITKLKKMGIIGNLNEPDLSPRENELKALSNLFSKACIVGKWSPDPKINLKLKQKYANLCELCEKPEKCDYPDKFSGYDGALRCLAHNNGQIAWTKVIYVRKFFGLPVGTTPAQPSNENPDDYRYLCPDATTVPINGSACRWAARPWQGFMTNADVAKTVDELRSKIVNLNSVGSQSHATWLKSVLELDEKLLPKETKIISPKDYLDKANYTDVIERDYGPPVKTIRFCVTSKDELEKCRTLSKSAFSRDIRPRFDCVEEKDVEGCLKTIRDNGADVITLHGIAAEKAKSQFNLKPIVSEIYQGQPDGFTHTVAVVKKDSPFQSISDLKGKKSCHPAVNSLGGSYAPIYNLIKEKQIKKEGCPYETALAEFFSGGSCAPGAKNLTNVPVPVIEKLCSLCGGNVDANDGTSLDSKCNRDSTESYFGYDGAFRCLAQGVGDVAFVLQDTVSSNTNGKNLESWAKDLKSGDYELLCPNGGRVSVDKFSDCYFSRVPSRTVLTSNSKSDGEVDEIKNALVSISSLYTKRPDLFKLFGPFNGKSNLLFLDKTTGLVSLNYESEPLKEFSEMLSTLRTCPSDALQ
ncbi:transferrin [Agrilus planipennis]|uniref:Transferrin n=1 Tax=Agrilus planipennis TaxID=224129 RepID=A0A1W4WDU6_AGRPL|nr:transferrin [Agrilus planipennis]